MDRAIEQFKDNIKYVRELYSLYEYLTITLMLPNDLSDLLRAQWVYTISAMDKLIHELIRTGMVEAYQGRRFRTRKFLGFSLSVDMHLNIASSSLPPAEYWFEQEVMQKHKTQSFQDPDKIVDGLGLIWEEPHKMQAIAVAMGIPSSTLITQLKTIVARRNQIVHEADIDLLTGTKNNVVKADLDIVIPFIENFSEKLYTSVKLTI